MIGVKMWLFPCRTSESFLSKGKQALRKEEIRARMTAPSTDVKPVVFSWDAKINSDLYDVQGQRATKKTGDEEYFPLVAAQTFQPGSGKYYWEVAVNGDNMKLGVCTDDADMKATLGVGKGLHSLSLYTGACESEGQKKKTIWRLVTPAAGGKFGFVWDSDKGTLQVWFGNEFMGTAVTEDFGLAGKAVRPCVGIRAIEHNNRTIGIGMKAAEVLSNPLVPPNLYI